LTAGAGDWVPGFWGSALVKPGDGDAAAKWRLVMALLVVSIPRSKNLACQLANCRYWPCICSLELGVASCKSGIGESRWRCSWGSDCCAACQD